MMIRDFEDHNISEMIYVLYITDETKLSDVTNDLAHGLERTDSLRSNIFYLISFKRLVDTNNKQEDKQYFDYSIMFIFNHLSFWSTFEKRLLLNSRF